MDLLLIADAFPPMRTSAAIHMHELAVELHQQGHQVSVLIPVNGIQKGVSVKRTHEYQLIEVGTLKTKGTGYIRRVLAEFINPFLIFSRVKSTNTLPMHLNGVIWYSPSIFFGPLVKRLVKKFQCPSYLILRDIFPRWALDLGLMKKGINYFILRCVEYYQYTVADIIGIQSPGNAPFFSTLPISIQSKVEVLWTWISSGSVSPCSIDISQGILSGRKILVYAGNMGVAQNLQSILDLAIFFKNRSDVGFLFVGRGDNLEHLKPQAFSADLKNVLFYPEIDPSQIPTLYSQCSAGIVSLDSRHKTQNIPGKFLSYMKFGLPVLAKVNPGNDLIELISQNRVGVTVTNDEVLELREAVEKLLNMLDVDEHIHNRCKDLAQYQFSTERAAKQIVAALSSKKA